MNLLIYKGNNKQTNKQTYRDCLAYYGIDLEISGRPFGCILYPSIVASVHMESNNWRYNLLFEWLSLSWYSLIYLGRVIVISIAYGLCLPLNRMDHQIITKHGHYNIISYIQASVCGLKENRNDGVLWCPTFVHIS